MPKSFIENYADYENDYGKEYLCEGVEDCGEIMEDLVNIPACGSDGRIYKDYCEMLKESCKSGLYIEQVSMDKCHKKGKST